ncbi:MAG: hypothetical protein ACTSRA_00560 [Promethearchaeota archaeon]|nr:MAG: hypothetical protein [Helarchaeota virus Nidhogg Meg22_1012]URC17450.1 MAG: hypothetical protein [Helarchaeota virus Nidhogg Meg22_1214]
MSEYIDPISSYMENLLKTDFHASIMSMIFKCTRCRTRSVTVTENSTQNMLLALKQGFLNYSVNELEKTQCRSCNGRLKYEAFVLAYQKGCILNNSYRIIYKKANDIESVIMIDYPKGNNEINENEEFLLHLEDVPVKSSFSATIKPMS